MYTGIVAGTAPVTRITDDGPVRTLIIDLEGFAEELQIGASVALDGVCMTVVSIQGAEVRFDAIEETMERTTLGRLEVGDLVNVERSLRMGDELHVLKGNAVLV